MAAARLCIERGTFGIVASDGQTLLVTEVHLAGLPAEQVRALVGEEAWQEAISDIPSPHATPPVTPPVYEDVSLLRRAGQAVKAIAQNVIKVNQRPKDQVDRIRAICNACPSRGKFDFCSGCGCNLTQKIQNADTHCPMIPPKWGTAKEEAAKLSPQNDSSDMVK